METNLGITFACFFNKATTTVDGGWNVTFSVSQDEAKSVLGLSTLRDTLLQIAIVPVDSLESGPLDG